jgi:carbon storage regulator
MLVLSRKIGERIVVPQYELAVTVLAVEGKVVRLGISAPEDIAVYREEVWQQLCQETHGPSPKE